MTKSKGILIRDPETRFWKYTVITPDCWVWIGPMGGTDGYGQFRVSGTLTAVHRYSYTLLVGPIDIGKEIDHLCRNRRCVRPDHLEVVTHKVNMERSGKAMSLICPNGHRRTSANIYVDPRGRKSCRRCTADAQSRYKARKQP